MPSNAPAMPKAGPITSTGWPRLQPGATRARTPGTAAPDEQSGGCTDPATACRGEALVRLLNLSFELPQTPRLLSSPTSTSEYARGDWTIVRPRERSGFSIN